MGWLVAGGAVLLGLGGLLRLWGISLLKSFVWLFVTLVLIVIGGNFKETAIPSLFISPLLALVVVNPDWLRRLGG